MWRKVGVFRPSDCNTRLVLKRFYKGSDRGAVVMLVAVLAGAGVLTAALALAVDIGRLLVAKSQVQAAADSTVQSIVARCLKTGCVDAVTMATVINQTVNPAEVKLVGACWNSSPDTSTPTVNCTSGYTSAQAAASCPVLTNQSGQPVGPTDPWIRIVVTNLTPVSTVFISTGARSFTGCGQGIWWSGVTHAVPAVMLLPACQIGLIETSTLLWQKTANSNQVPVTPVSDSPPTTCTVNWGKIDPNNPTTNVTVNSPTTDYWTNEVGGIVGQQCVTGDLKTYPLVINGTTTTSTKIIASGLCSAQQLAAYFDTSTANAAIGGQNPRWMGLSGHEVLASDATTDCPKNSTATNCLVQVPAFAQFQLQAIFDGANGCWYLPTANSAVPAGSPWTQANAINGGKKSPCGSGTGSADPLYANNSQYCNAKAGKLCLWGRFSNVEVAGYGNASVPGYTVRP